MDNYDELYDELREKLLSEKMNDYITHEDVIETLDDFADWFETADNGEIYWYSDNAYTKVCRPQMRATNMAEILEACLYNMEQYDTVVQIVDQDGYIYDIDGYEVMDDGTICFTIYS